MKKRIVCVGLLLISCLTACGREASIDEFGDSNVSQQDELGNDSVDLNSIRENDLKQIPQHVKETWEIGNSSSVDIDADVLVPNMDNINIYQFNKKEMNDEFLKKMSLSLFDDGKYDAGLPREYWSLENVAAEQEEMQKLVRPEEGLFVPNTIAKEQEKILSSSQTKQGELKTDCVIFEEMNATADKMLERNARIRGDINGKPYELFFKETFTDARVYAFEVIPLFPVTRMVHTISMEENAEENICGYEDARKKAAELMEKLGYTDLSEAHTLQRVCEDENGDVSLIDGYQIYYSRNLDEGLAPILANGLFFYENEMLKNYDEIDDFQFATQEYVRISVDHTGVVSADIHSDMEMGELLLPNPNTISFEQVQEIMRNRLKNATTFDKESLVFTAYMSNVVSTIQLTYLPSLDEGTYTYIPVWIFMIEDSTKQIAKQNATIGVSALDGEIIFMEPLLDGAYTGIE